MTHSGKSAARHVCVTGGAGFIGSHIVDALVTRGDSVTVLDDLSTGSRDNLARHGDKVRLVVGSILDPDALRLAFADAELVYHEAALCSVPASIESPRKYCEVNITGTLNVLEAARQAGVRRVVYAASSSAYGNQDALPVSESLTPDPISPYAATKLAGEHLLRAYAACYDISCISLRYFNVYGPRQAPDSPYAAVVPKFAAAMLAGRKPIIFGDGEQTRDFTFVGNVVHANLLAGDSQAPLKGEVVNIGCGERSSVNDLLHRITAHLKLPADCDKRPPRAGDVRDSMASIDRAHDLIGYRPIVPFAEGLRITLDWYAQSRGRTPRSASANR